MVLAILREELGKCSSVAELCRVLGISRDALERLRSVAEVDALIVDFLK